MRARGSVLIQRGPAEVFTYVSDPAKDPSWRSLVVASHAADAVLQAGSIVRQTYSYQGHAVDLETEVSELAPPERIGFRTRGQIQAHIVYTCTPEAGGTRFNMSMSAEVTGPAALLAGRIQRELEQAIGTDLKRLKAALERHGGS
jgi:uncharacterized protein YndB with AHSA1/START domain